jgi:hypothetical protein
VGSSYLLVLTTLLSLIIVLLLLFHWLTLGTLGLNPSTTTTLAHGLSITGISHLTPTFVEMMHLVPIPTYLGKSHIICDSRDLPSSSHCDNSFDPVGKDFSWSRGLGLETSPIKTCSARRKTRSSVTHPTVTSTDTSDLGALRGIKSLARSRP